MKISVLLNFTWTNYNFKALYHYRKLQFASHTKQQLNCKFIPRRIVLSVSAAGSKINFTFLKASLIQPHSSISLEANIVHQNDES